MIDIKLLLTEDAYSKTAKDKEGRQAIEHGVECFGHHHAGVLGFACCHGDVVGSGDCEGGLDEALEEAEEATECAIIVKFCEGTGILPVSEPEAVPDRVASQHGDEGEDDQGDN